MVRKGVGFFNRFLVVFLVLIVIVVALAVFYKPIQLAPAGSSGSGVKSCSGSLIGNYVKTSNNVSTTYNFYSSDSSGNTCPNGYCLTTTSGSEISYTGCVQTSCESSTNGNFALLSYDPTGGGGLLDRMYFRSVPDESQCVANGYIHFTCPLSSYEGRNCIQGCETINVPDPLSGINVTVAHCINDSFNVV